MRVVAGLTLLLLAGCRPGGDADVVYTSVDDVFSAPVLRAFEQESGLRALAVHDVEAEKTTGLFHRLLAERDRPRADVFWCSEPARMVQLERAGLLEPYSSPAASGLPARLRRPSWTGFAERARVLVYHTGRVLTAERPRSILDLASERFRGEAAISDPLFGTMATHAGALHAVLGKEKFEELFRSLLEGGAQVLPGNSVVRDRVASGEVKIGLTDSDDAAVGLARGLPLGVVFPDQDIELPGLGKPLGTYLFPCTAALIRGGPHPEAARRLLDRLVSERTEADLATSEACHFPAREGVPRPSTLDLPPGTVRMDVDPEAAARGLEESQDFLRKLLLR